MRVLRLIPLLALALLICGFRGQATGLDEQAPLYAWFDSLGFSQFKDGTFVEVRIWKNWNGKKEAAHSEFGFLLDATGKSFNVLTLGLERLHVVDGNLQGQPSTTTDLGPIDLHNWLTTQRGLWERASDSAFSNGPYPYGFGFSPRGRAFVLARLADLRGWKDVGDFFYQKSREARLARRNSLYSVGLKTELADGLLAACKRHFGSVDVSRKEMLSDLDLIVDHFPDSAPRKEASSYASVLRPMVKEDAERLPAGPDKLKAMSPSARARELVWQLRDQTGAQMTDPGYPDVLRGYPRGRTPANGLVNLGLSSVPPLLDALHDKRWTRCVEVGMIAQPRVLRIRDAALQVLEEISCRRFSRSPEGIEGDSDQMAAATEQKARAWWSEIQQKGERQVLVEAVSRGDLNSPKAARRLVQAYPGSALAAIEAGLKRSSAGYIPSELVRALNEVDTPAVRRFVAKTMLEGPDIDTRLAAARIVCRSDPKAAVSAMSKEWRRIVDGGPKGGYLADIELPEFLGACGDPSGIAALAYRFGSKTAAEKIDILSRISMPPKPTPTFAKAAEDLVAGSLQDMRSSYGESIAFGSTDFSNPRVCDIAAFRLAEMFPAKYRFSNFASTSARNRQALGSFNTWRRSRGLALVPVPVYPKLAPADPAIIGPLLKASNSGPLDQRMSAEHKIEATGPPALPALVKFAWSMPEHDPVGQELRAMASRIGCRVREVRVANIPPQAAAFAARVSALKGKSLTAEEVEAIVAGAAHSWPEGALGFTFQGDRDEDGLGIVLSLDLGKAITSENIGGRFNFVSDVMIDGHDEGGSSGAANSEFFIDDDSFMPSLRSAIDSNPFIPIRFFVSMERGTRH